MHNQRIPRIEIIIAIIGFLGLGIALTLIEGKEAHTDVLWYMNMNLNNIQDGMFQTRYTHVFLQKIFLEAFSNPFDGLKYFWSFLITMTSALIYFNARTLFKRSNIIHAVLAVVFFLTHHVHAESAGVALIDYTTALVVMLIVTLYLYSARHNHNKRWVIYAIGFAFFLAFKTKESAWVVGVLVLGFGISRENKFDLRVMRTFLKEIFLGMLFCFVTFTFLNGLLLGDYFFGFRLDHLRLLFTNWFGEGQRFSEVNNWYVDEILTFFPLAFILYLISGIRNNQNGFPTELKLVWSIPLILVIFLTLSMGKGDFGLISRFMLPGFAVISVFAPQAIDFSFSYSPKKEFAQFLGSFVVGLIILFGLRITFLNYADTAGIIYGDFLTSIINPIFFTMLFGFLILTEKFTLKTIIIPLVLLVALTSTPLLENFRRIKRISNKTVVQTRFYPFYKYGEYISYNEEMLMYVSQAIPLELGFFSDDINTMYTLFDLHFDEKTSPSNFTYSPVPEDIFDNILAKEYDYIFLTEQEWGMLTSEIDTNLQIETACSVHHDSDEPLVFLKCN